MKYSVIVAATVLALAPSVAHTQVTTFIPPKPKPVVVESPARAAERSDSVARAAMTDMKAWVDSAAVAVDVKLDTTDVPPRPSELPQRGDPLPDRGDPLPQPDRVTEFREGSRAPDTATPLPMLAAVAVGALALGGLFLRRPGA